MADSSSYGEAFGERLRARATSIVSRSLQHPLLAVTEVRSDDPQRGLSSSLVREDAFLVAVQLRDYPIHEYWEDGNCFKTRDQAEQARDAIKSLLGKFHKLSSTKEYENA